MAAFLALILHNLIASGFCTNETNRKMYRARNKKEYDFMKGDESYKFELADKTRRNLNLEFVNRRLVSHLIILVIQVKKILFLKNRKITKASIKHLLSLFNSRVDKKLIKQHN